MLLTQQTGMAPVAFACISWQLSYTDCRFLFLFFGFIFPLITIFSCYSVGTHTHHSRCFSAWEFFLKSFTDFWRCVTNKCWFLIMSRLSFNRPGLWSLKTFLPALSWKAALSVAFSVHATKTAVSGHEIFIFSFFYLFRRNFRLADFVGDIFKTMAVNLGK